MTFSTTGICMHLQYHMCIPFCAAGCQSNHREVDYSQVSCATIAQVCVSCPVGGCCSQHSPQVGETVNEFSPLAAYIASSGTMDADQQEKIFQFASHLISSCPITPWDVFSERVLTYASDDQ